MKKKKDFLKRYNVRGHIVAKDMRKGSSTYGKIFHRAELGDWQPHTMTEVKDAKHLRELLKKGARKVVKPDLAFMKVPNSAILADAEKYAMKKLGIGEVSYKGIEKTSADFLNGYLRGATEKLGFSPTRVLFDDAMFTGANRKIAALAMEDGTIFLNRNYLGTVEKMTKTNMLQFRMGQFTTSSPGHVINHEMGHLKYFHMGGTEATANRKFSKNVLFKLKKDIGSENLRKYVSKYAMKSQGEFYAEMVAKELNGEALHPICKKYMKNIESALRRKQIKRIKK